MARLIVKSPYVKGKAGGYLKYMGTRDGVELLEQQAGGYAVYMARRPRSHGLFGDEDSVNMAAAIKELNEYSGNIWTHIISLRREDAERLGYDNAKAWRNLLRAHRNEIAEAMRIPPQDFRWYAAFHDEGEHPHVHLLAWSAKPGQAYLSRSGIEQIKSVLTNDIFKQEMLHLYEQKSTVRDELVRQSRQALRDLAREMQSGICDHPEVEELMLTLAAQLETVKGKKSYGYLPKKAKATVNEIVDQMERIPAVHEYYAQWWEVKCQLRKFYTEQQRKRTLLSEQKEFRHIKNAVIQEAERLRLGDVTFRNESMASMSDKISPVVQSVTWLLYHMGRIFQDRVPAPQITGGIQIDHKRLEQIRQKKIALGHKPDDHEDYYNGPTMSM